MPADGQQRRMSFDRDPVPYHHGRPPYPRRAYDLLAGEYGLASGCRVLEIGAGSGIATGEMLARGARVTAVEPGAALAEPSIPTIRSVLKPLYTRVALAVPHLARRRPSPSGTRRGDRFAR